jgi:hypothetical protein
MVLHNDIVVKQENQLGGCFFLLRHFGDVADLALFSAYFADGGLL